MPQRQHVSGSSFYWALRFLPARRRRAMFALYSYCRAVDDIADGTIPAAQKRRHLARYARAVEDLYDGRRPDVVEVRDLAQAAADFGFAKADLLAVIAGMRMDAEDRVRLADRGALEQYMDRVACAVGRLSNRVFGLAGKEADALAYHLGRALQLTNILRDLREDAQRDRMYLPGDLLREHGLEGAAPHEILDHANLSVALDRLAAEAEQDFGAAQAILSTTVSRAARPARMMMAVYRRLFDKLKTRGLSRVDVPVRLGRGEKMWIALRYGIL